MYYRTSNERQKAYYIIPLTIYDLCYDNVGHWSDMKENRNQYLSLDTWLSKFYNWRNMQCCVSGFREYLFWEAYPGLTQCLKMSSYWHKLKFKTYYLMSQRAPSFMLWDLRYASDVYLVGKKTFMMLIPSEWERLWSSVLLQNLWFCSKVLTILF